MNKSNIYNRIVENMGIKEGETVLLASDLITIFIYFKKKNLTFDLNIFLDIILQTLGRSGTLLLPTHNWEFCNGAEYDYYKTKCMTGSLGKIALQRNDFKRSINPIFSFAISGFDKNYYASAIHNSCFGLNSPFDLLYKNNAKHVSLNLDYKDTGFTFVHYIEEKIGVSYRFFKNFKGFYVDENKVRKKIKYDFYVRDLQKAVRTGIKIQTDIHLQSINAFKKIQLDWGYSSIIDLKKTVDYLIKNIQDNKGHERLVYPMLTGKFSRKSITNFEYLE